MQITRASWPVRYFDGETARRQEVSLRITPSGLHFRRDDGSDHVWPFSEIQQTQGRNRGEPVRLERGMEAMVIQDPEFLAAIAQHRLGKGIRGAGSVGKGAAIALGSAIGLLAIGAGLYLWGIPALAKIAASRVPLAWEVRLGESVTAKLAPAETRSQDPAANAALEAMVARLAGEEPSSYPYRVAIVEAPVVNALAAPGGHILVYRGLIDRARTPEEVAGVLAHEMAHVELRHTTQAMFRELSMQALLAALSGDPNGMGQILEAVGGLGALRYSRSAELEADREGMRRIRDAAIDPRGMVRFFEELQKQEEGLPLLKALSSHPPTQARLEAAKTLALDWQASAKKARPILTSEQWQALRRRPQREAASAHKPSKSE
ncbi:TPR repeat-containing protein YfgC precursor [compost metagenome]